MTRTAILGDTILVADLAGDRPAIITKVFSNTTVEACGYLPAPEVLKLVIVHADRHRAIAAALNNPAGYHAYWKA